MSANKSSVISCQHVLFTQNLVYIISVFLCLWTEFKQCLPFLLLSTWNVGFLLLLLNMMSLGTCTTCVVSSVSRESLETRGIFCVLFVLFCQISVNTSACVGLGINDMAEIYALIWDWTRGYLTNNV